MKKVFLFLLLITGIINAGTTGKIAGRIIDSQTKEPLIGANIVITGTNYGAATDLDGNFVILNIPPGKYTVKISSIGYKTVVVNDLSIIVDRTTSLSYSLDPTTIEVGEIIVSSQTPMIQKDITSSVSVMTRDEIESLPVASFTDLLSMQAGVVGSGSNLHIRGGRSNEVAYLIDGMYVQDPLMGGLATQINNDAIQEMSLLSGTFNAEYGNALSGVVNIVTRDGADKLSGKIEMRTSEFGMDRYSSLRETRFNGNLSGPLFTEKLKFFLSAEQDKKGSYLPFGYRNERTFFSKLTYSGLSGIKATFSNRGSVGDRRPYNHSWKYIPEQYLVIRNDSYQSAFTFTHTVQNNLFYDFRISYFNQGNYSGVDKDTSLYIPIQQREYMENKGNGFEFYSKADPAEFSDSRTATIDGKFDLVWQLDKTNEIKTGFQYKKHWLRLFSIYDPKRTFPYIDHYNTNPYEAAGYIQDKIELPFLIINLGLRFDYMNANITFRSNPLDPKSLIKVEPRHQFSPRIGIAHPISDKTKLHFAYGHFFQYPNYQYFFENNQYDLNVREPLFGQPNLDAERTITYEVGISHQFTDKIAGHLTAYYKDVTGKIGTRYYFPFVDGRYTGYTEYINEDYSNIKGFEVTLDARADKYFSGGLAYTFSVAKGSASSETEQYPGTSESTLLYYLDFDQTHVFNASASIVIPENDGPEIFGSKIFGNTDLNVIFRASSGYPYTPSGRDIGFVVRNSLRMPAIYTIDLEIGKEFELFNTLTMRAFVEVLNLTDHRNVLYVYGDTGEPDLTFVGANSPEYVKDPSNFGPPRTIRLGLSTRF
ncbi:MAG: carboxypeptidase-like regulatory domain-containing protein [Melioribacteraceae bacterium]